jgi:hypothetical protein
MVLPNQAELSRVVDRVQQAGLPMEQRADGILVRDPAQISVVLTARSTG